MNHDDPIKIIRNTKTAFLKRNSSGTYTLTELYFKNVINYIISNKWILSL